MKIELSGLILNVLVQQRDAGAGVGRWKNLALGRVFPSRVNSSSCCFTKLVEGKKSGAELGEDVFEGWSSL